MPVFRFYRIREISFDSAPLYGSIELCDVSNNATQEGDNMKRLLKHYTSFGLPVSETTVITIEEEMRAIAEMLNVPLSRVTFTRHNSADSFGNQGVYNRIGSTEFVTLTYLRG